MVRPKLPENLRSPLSDEIRKMFQEAIADTTPKKISSPGGLNRSRLADGIENVMDNRRISGKNLGPRL